MAGFCHVRGFFVMAGFCHGGFLSRRAFVMAGSHQRKNIQKTNRHKQRAAMLTRGTAVAVGCARRVAHLYLTHLTFVP